jgi:hypothetical protein
MHRSLAKCAWRMHRSLVMGIIRNHDAPERAHPTCQDPGLLQNRQMFGSAAASDSATPLCREMPIPRKRRRRSQARYVGALQYSGWIFSCLGVFRWY